MLPDVLIFLCFVYNPILTATVKQQENLCSSNEFTCADNACISIDHVCDGVANCADASDEAACRGSSHGEVFDESILNRLKRQSRCSKNQWQCRNGDCIGFDGKCDGTIDCNDGSDETFALCRRTRCQSNWFRCTYGACVDGTAPCNGLQECADNSDELLPRCRNETDERVRFQFTCANGRVIPASSHCDGVDDCGDASDESLRTCASKKCPTYLFQCAYGACVDSGSDCNGVQECADNSDESDELCNRSGTGTTTTTKRPVAGGNCVLPPYPDHGRYTVGGVPNASPGQSFFSFQLNVTCNTGYGVVGNSSIFCIDGSWSLALPECIRFCKLNKHPSVRYRCVISEEHTGTDGFRACNALEPSGTSVKPICREPNYYYSGILSYMHCIDGSWDYVAICTPGLPQNGTKITILITDKIEVSVDNFLYYVPLFVNANDENVPGSQNAGESSNDIHSGDWRLGGGKAKFSVGNRSVEVRVDGGNGIGKGKDTL